MPPVSLCGRKLLLNIFAGSGAVEAGLGYENGRTTGVAGPEGSILFSTKCMPVFVACPELSSARGFGHVRNGAHVAAAFRWLGWNSLSSFGIDVSRLYNAKIYV